MRRTLKLRTGEGKDFRIILDNWGSGLDQSMRRWILQDGLWQCTDSAALAEESVVDFKRPVRQLLHAPTAADAKEAARDVHETAVAPMRGQTMAEYARGVPTT